MRAISGFILVALGASAAGTGGMAAVPDQPAFVVDDGLQFTFPISGSPPEDMAFLVASKVGSLTDVKLRVLEFKDPDGRSRDTAVLHAPLVVGVVAVDGKRIILRPDAAHFKLAGDYRVALDLEGTADGQKEPVKALIKLIIHRPPPELNLDELKDQTIKLTRAAPWTTASGTAVLSVRETSGKGDVSDLVVTGRPLLRQEDREQVPGDVTASIRSTEIMAGRDLPVTLTFSNVARAGSFTTQVSLASPSFGTAKSIGLKVVVQEFWFWPLLAITVGVGACFGTHYAAQTLRPNRENRYRIVRLRAEINLFSQSVRKAAKLAILASLADRVRAGEDQNTLGQFAAAKALLDKVEPDLANFITAEAADRVKVEAASHDLLAQVEQNQQQRAHAATPVEMEFFGSSAAGFREIDTELAVGQIDRAADRLDEIARSFDVLTRYQIEQRLQALQARLEALAVPHERKQDADQVLSKIILAWKQLANGKADEAKATAVDAEADFKFLEIKIGGGAAHAETEEFGALELESAVAETPALPTRLVATDKPEARGTDSPLGFRIDDNEHLLVAGDTFQWHFGDSAAFSPGQALASHQFAQPGAYRVKVEVVRGGALILELARDVVVLPGRTQMELGKLGLEILVINTILSLIALLLACLTGLLYLYVGKSFGTVSDYLLAALWGFGIDNSVRGFAAVLPKVTGAPGS